MEWDKIKEQEMWVWLRDSINKTVTYPCHNSIQVRTFKYSWLDVNNTIYKQKRRKWEAKSEELPVNLQKSLSLSNWSGHQNPR